MDKLNLTTHLYDLSQINNNQLIIFVGVNSIVTVGHKTFLICGISLLGYVIVSHNITLSYLHYIYVPFVWVTLI